MDYHSESGYQGKSSLAMAVFTIAALGFLLYAPSFSGEFVSDDYLAIVDNPAVRQFQDIVYIWQSFNTRFLTGLTFAINYRLGGLDPFGYHLINVILHILTSLCVCWLTQLTLRTSFLKQFFREQEIGWMSFWAALIFLAHPVQTQAVSFVTQRAVGLATLFYLLTIIFYVKGRLSDGKKNRAIALFFILLGLLTKEMVVTIPLALMLYEKMFLQQSWKKCFKHVGIFFIAWIILPVLLWQNQAGSVLGLKQQVLGQGLSWPYFLTELNVLRTYWRLFFIPVNLIHDYHYPMAQSLWEAPVLISLVWHGALIILAVRVYQKARLVSFCIFWFYLTTTIEALTVSVVNRKVIFEHWMYLPMVGLSVVLAYAMSRWIAKERLRNIAVVALVIVLSLLSVSRNQVWQREIDFWSDNVLKTPHNAQAYLGLGKAYERKNMVGKAVLLYQKALSLDPRLTQALNNLGCIYANQGQSRAAQKYFQRILIIDPQNVKAYNNLAYLDFLKGRHKEAVQNYEMSLQYQPPYPEGLFYAGQSYLALGQKEKAKEYLQKARDLYKKQSQFKEAQDVERLLAEIR